ncbi:hypothetical protein BOX15_Mlig030796g1, partial [Macrostomum lignano]
LISSMPHPSPSASVLPRFTTALRVFSNADEQQADDRALPVSPAVLANDDLDAKRRWRFERAQQNALDWPKLLTRLKSRTSSTGNLNKIADDADALLRSAVGTDSPDWRVSCAQFFMSACRPLEATLRMRDQLKRNTGCSDTALIDRTIAACRRLAEAVGPDWNEAIDPVDVKNGDVDKSDSTETMFGQTVKFNDALTDFDAKNSADVEEYNENFFAAPDEGDNVPSYIQNFSLAYKPQQSKQQTTELSRQSVQYNLNWLAALTGAELAEPTAAVLESAGSDDSIQNELLELLGFERIEVIAEILESRTKFLQQRNLADEKLDDKRDPTAAEDQLIDSLIASQQAHARSYAEGPKMPTGPGRLAGTNARYPFVFDELADALRRSAYIAGASVMLPATATQRSTPKFDEVTLPPSSAKPTHVGANRVPLAELDELTQRAFPGTSHLNAIQTVVFDSAYKTNENLLICAPTGAGKTNIAMLTVLHEIKQNIGPGGVVKRDDFKIVYVCPMKALAAEMTANFGKRLAPLGLTVRECTGDMQLTKAEIAQTQMLLVTPEKWDVLTRKSIGDVGLTQLVKLLIIDEVHLLHDERGAVIESIVARTLRQVESSQKMIRIVGLSATLPNYLDVAQFLRVNPYKGLFFFDARFRPVPLGTSFVGIKSTNIMQQQQDFMDVCFDKVVEQVRQGEQVMVFVHSRPETRKTAIRLREMARESGAIKYFLPADPNTSHYGRALKEVGRSHNQAFKELFADGFTIHNAGMLRSDRNLAEKYFAQGMIRCLVCTATLAWGVNLPAHAVIIKGTQIYNAEKSTFVDLGILDVQQIFGRAGRPQFDKVGYGTIITTHDKLSRYLTLMCSRNPIESSFMIGLADNLNAEVALGTVANTEEAVRWLSYTYLHVRMKLNPLVYGISPNQFATDPNLENHRLALITLAARKLDSARMIRFDERTGYLASTDLGRIASHFYIKFNTVEVWNDELSALLPNEKVLSVVSKSKEFEQVKVREEELPELDQAVHNSCQFSTGGVENSEGKVSALLQVYIDRQSIETASLVSDQAYVVQNCSRVVQALFEYCMRKGWPQAASSLLTWSKCINRRLWPDAHPLRQFDGGLLRWDIVDKLERAGPAANSVEALREMPRAELDAIIRLRGYSEDVRKLAWNFPLVELEAAFQPITRTILRVRLEVRPHFHWNDRIHGKVAESFWVWVEDTDNQHVYHSDMVQLSRKSVQRNEPAVLAFTIPIFEPLPTHYVIRCESERWLHAGDTYVLSFKHLRLPQSHPPHSELLDLNPLPVSVLKAPQFESICSFTHMNPVQTQVFHAAYHTDCNLLVGAPTGSGKTFIAELAIFRVFKTKPGLKCVYIAPLKALVRERINDWKKKLEPMNKKVVELTGDVAPDMKAVAAADLIVTTPEKWDGCSRSWQQRQYVQQVALLVIDEIHLLGEDRGPVLEVIVSRTNFICSHTKRPVRVVGLSTALANAQDLSDWLGIRESLGMYNFRPSVRPVPLEVHIQGYPGRHYCPRMASMNKPAFQAIRQHSPAKPVLIFVSSRRQTRLTALDLIAYLAGEDDPKQWLHMEEAESALVIDMSRDANLKLTLAFGIGLHHAGLHERDRRIVEELYALQKIQVLIATSTVAWGVNFPSHLVIIKGTEYFDGKTKHYVDYPITDVLQMMGRAGRPQFDTQGKAVVMVHDAKKHFYKRFLYEPFPVESSLLGVLSDHLNAEIVAGTICSKQDAMDYLTWTYFFRRVTVNPSYYGLESTDHSSLNAFLSRLVEKACQELMASACIEVDTDSITLSPTVPGRIAAFYYLSHLTVKHFKSVLRQDASVSDLLSALTDCQEFAELPVRHNEDQLNAEINNQCRIRQPATSVDSPHCKAHLLLQSHFSRLAMPIADYGTDLKSVLDQAIRIVQAMIDMCADCGWLSVCLRAAQLIQMLVQARWFDEDPLITLPSVETFHLPTLRQLATPAHRLDTLPGLLHAPRPVAERAIREALGGRHAESDRCLATLAAMPRLRCHLELVKVVQQLADDSEGEEESNNPAADDEACKIKIPLDGRDWISVDRDAEYSLNLRLVKTSYGRTPGDTRAQAPRFPKAKDEGLIVVLGHAENDEVQALKRIPALRQRVINSSMVFLTPEDPGRVVYNLYVMSDAYIGLDQQYQLRFDVG